jgi:hypothetical protein
MQFPDFAIDERLVSATEKAAFEAFSRMTGAADGETRAAAAIQFADVLGSPGEFRQYASGGQADRLARIERLLRIFRENAELLVHKTWVEKSDERRKERLIEEIAAFEREFRDGAVERSFSRFVGLCRSIAHLLFGGQSRADDFLHYCFRIDPHLGLFFWFVEALEEQSRAGSHDHELLTMETLLGMYALASF